MTKFKVSGYELLGRLQKRENQVVRSLVVLARPEARPLELTVRAGT
jgi:hypothetical protein